MKPVVHELKTWCEFYDMVFSGVKRFEIRKDDRGFEVGDWLILKEWDHEKESYTGRWLQCYVTCKIDGGQFGIEQGYCVLGISEWRVTGRTRDVPAPVACPTGKGGG